MFPARISYLQVHYTKLKRQTIRERKKEEEKMECNGRPNRSDIHLTMEEEAKLEEQTREYFDGLAPKRHTKPQRSEYSSQYVDTLSFTNGNISHDHASSPEFLQFQRLEADPQKLSYNAKGEAGEEFTETEYYKDLNCIDRQHHTTGTGFIKMEKANGKSFTLTPDSETCCHESCKGNPATNDWIPAAPDAVIVTSDKPRRSDN